MLCAMNRNRIEENKYYVLISFIIKNVVGLGQFTTMPSLTNFVPEKKRKKKSNLGLRHGFENVTMIFHDRKH